MVSCNHQLCVDLSKDLPECYIHKNDLNFSFSLYNTCKCYIRDENNSLSDFKFITTSQVASP